VVWVGLLEGEVCSESVDPALSSNQYRRLRGCEGKCTSKAGNLSSCSLEMSSTSVTCTSLSGRVKVDIFAAGGGLSEEMRWPARR
jgi:hypothetical protein